MRMQSCRIRLMGKLLNSVVVVAISAAAVLIVSAGAALAQSDAKTVGPSAETLKKMRTAGVNYLKTTQADDGSWTSPMAPGITALVTAALIDGGVAADDPSVIKALNHLKSHIQQDGGIYYTKSQHRNYESCIALIAFKKANANGQYDTIIANVLNFLKKQQWDEGEGLESADARYGGAGYGRHERPDLSNTQFLLDALKEAGAGPDDPAVKKALIFVSRSQNLETEYNNTPFAALVNDGGFYYTPAAGGTSEAGKTPEGGLRSYGSMTYAGLKSFIYAGLKTDDRRVKAAFEWIRRFYTIDENPGMGQQGVFYYYHTFAKALAVLDLDYFEDAKGNKHDWRRELTEKLAGLQKENGSWVNPTPRWNEGDPNLSTAYVLMGLAFCDPKPASAPKK